MLTYSLTELTGARKNEGRQMVVVTIEVRRHNFIMSVIGVLGALVLLSVPAVLFGPWMLAFAVFGAPVAVLLFATRQRRGLQVYRYEALLNSRKRARGFWINGRQFSTPMFIMHTPTVVDSAQVDPDHPSQLRDDAAPSPRFARGTVDASLHAERASLREVSHA